MQNRKAPPGIVVAGAVVAVAGVAAAHDHPVGAALKCLDDEQGVDPAAARQPDNAHIGVHLQTAGPGQVGPGIRAPVANEGYNLRRPRMSLSGDEEEVYE